MGTLFFHFCCSFVCFCVLFFYVFSFLFLLRIVIFNFLCVLAFLCVSWSVKLRFSVEYGVCLSLLCFFVRRHIPALFVYGWLWFSRVELKSTPLNFLPRKYKSRFFIVYCNLLFFLLSVIRWCFLFVKRLMSFSLSFLASKMDFFCSYIFCGLERIDGGLLFLFMCCFFEILFLWWFLFALSAPGPLVCSSVCYVQQYQSEWDKKNLWSIFLP